MKIDINIEMKTLSGEALKQDENILTLKEVFITALLAEHEKDKGKTKFENYLLAEKIYECEDAIELTAEQASMLQERVAKAYKTIIAGQSWKILDGK